MLIAFWNTNKTAIIMFLVIAAVIGWIYFTIHGLRTDLQATKTELATASAKLENVTTQYNNLRTLAIDNQARINGYYGQLQQQALLYQNALKQIADLKSNEKEAIKNPQQATIVLQTQYDQAEKETACLTGNIQYCSQP